MHDAKQTLLSKITQGQKILVVEPPGTMSFEFGRPKDPTAVVSTVTQIEKIRDQWTGHTYVVQITGGRRNTGRYGTTHVYVTAEAPTEAEVELQQLNTWRRVTLSNGVMRVADWEGGDWTGTTPHGKPIHITADGVVTVLDGGTERTPSIDPLDEPTHRPATDAEAGTADRCHQCKGYGVVRKTGSKAGKAYRTLVGAEESTTKGNSERCPVCKGATLLVRTA